MNNWPTNLETIQDVIAFLNECAALRPEDLPQDRQVEVAASIVHLHSYDKYDEVWKSRYPQLELIVTLAEDLELSNAERGGWRQLKARLDVLNAIVNHEFHYDDTRERLKKIVIITQAIQYWVEYLKRAEDKQELARHMIDIAGNEHFLDEFYDRDKIFAEVFDILCDYATTGASQWRPWEHVERLVGLLQERWSD